MTATIAMARVVAIITIGKSARYSPTTAPGIMITLMCIIMRQY